jgi:hypothetical protein
MDYAIIDIIVPKYGVIFFITNYKIVDLSLFKNFNINTTLDFIGL